jgi:hypothetical protein
MEREFYTQVPTGHLHGRMARGAHGLPKVSLWPAQPDPYSRLVVARPQGVRPVAVFFPLGYPTPYGPASGGRAVCGRLPPPWTPHAVRACVRRAGGMRPSSTPLDTPHRTPMFVVTWCIRVRNLFSLSSVHVLRSTLLSTSGSTNVFQDSK